VILTGTCECGAQLTREQADGFGAHLLNDAPFLCSACSKKREAAWATQDREDQDRRDRDRLVAKCETLPTALRRFRLADLEIAGRENALDASRRWAAGELQGLVLLGPIGVGKTTIAAATDIDYMAAHLNSSSPRWISTTLALSDLSRSFSNPDRERTIEALTGKGTPLILDDIDKAKPNVFAAEQLFCAIDGCIAHDRPLLVTTNLMPSGLAVNWPKPYGQAIASRLAGHCELHKVTGRDRRLRRAA
jgi:DNA replication protein DnaC